MMTMNADKYCGITIMKCVTYKLLDRKNTEENIVLISISNSTAVISTAK